MIKSKATYDYNLIIIGGGSAGLVASLIAAATKAKVALIEKHDMGGDCLNTGCIPSKTLIKAARMAHDMRHSDKYGITSVEPKIDFKAVMQGVHKAIETIAPHDSVERFTGLGVDCFIGEARLTSPHQVTVKDSSGHEQVLSGRAIIVASGAEPLIPPIPGLHDIDFLSSDNLWHIEELPERLLVVGGGPIGIEMAQAFSRLGSQVTVVEQIDRIMAKEDEDVSTHISQVLTKEGLNLLTGHQVIGFNDANTVELKYGNEMKQHHFDKVLIALGRKARITGFGLEELGVKLNNGRTVAANPFLQTNVPSIYVCGDVTGPYQFTHTASHEAWYAAVNALFSPIKKFKVDYSVIPWATFTDPEVSRVGINEQEAKAQNIAYELTHYDLDNLDRAITEQKNSGFIKVLTKPNSDKILGVTIVGEHAGDLIAEFIFAMRHGLGLKKILGTIHIYPTWTEANKFSAGNWQKKHVPKYALRLLEKFHTWRRR